MTEGDDKALKCPALFSRINVLLITKSDLAPHLDFDAARAINAHADAFVPCARTGEGMEALYDCLDAGVAKVRAESRLLP